MRIYKDERVYVHTYNVTMRTPLTTHSRTHRHTHTQTHACECLALTSIVQCGNTSARILTTHISNNTKYIFLHNNVLTKRIG